MIARVLSACLLIAGHQSANAFVSPQAIGQRTLVTSNNNNPHPHLLPVNSQFTTVPQHSKTSLNLAGFEEAWSSYLTALEADPLLVKSITAGVILGAADLSGQAIQQAIASNDDDDNA